MATLVTGAVCAALLTVLPATGGAAPSPSHPSAAPAADARRTASLQARATGSPVLIDSLTTETSSTTANVDGSFTVSTSLLPRRMRDASGAWTALDPTLRRNPDGTVTTTATPDTLTFSGGGTGPVVQVADHHGHVLGLTLPTTLPAPSLAGASATYARIYPGVDLTVTASDQGGFSEVFTVHDAAAEAQAAHIAFKTSLTGLRLAADPAGNLSAVDTATGQVVMNAPPAAMWDSATTAAPGTAGADTDPLAADSPSSSAKGPGRGARTATLTAVPGAGSLTLNADFSRLSAGHQAFPLFVDPTWSAPHTSTAEQDSDEIQSGCSGTSNYNTITDLGVGYNEFSGCIGIERSLLLLSLSGLSKSDHILSSDFKITSDFSSDNSCGQATYNVSLFWTGTFGSGTDWSNQPSDLSNSSVPSPMSTRAVKTDGNSVGTQCSGGVPVDFSITGPIAYFVSQGAGTLSVGMHGYESASSSLERFNRSTAALDTTYDVPPGTPTTLTATPVPVLPGGSQDPCGSTTAPGYEGISNLAGKTVATLSAKAVSSIAAAQMYGIFSITDATANTTTTTDSSGYVTNGGTVSVNTPTLVDGHKYQWSLHTSDQYLTSPQTGTCAFVTDEKAPLNPTVSSAGFPPLSGGTTGTVTTGQTGSLTLTSSDPAPASGTASGLRGFYYAFDTPVPTSGATFTAAAGGSATVSFSTTQWGVHTLYTEGTDNAGNISAQSSYSFYVPWNPAAKVAAGDVNGDGVPDLVTVDGSGDLVQYAGNTSPGTAPAVLSTAAQSPDGLGTSWASYLVTHAGSLTNGAVDDLWALDTVTHNLYLDKNTDSTTGGNFSNTANVVAVTKAGVLSDEYNDSTAGAGSPTNACFTTSTGSCAAYNGTDWTGVTQVVAPGDLYAGDPVAGIDNGAPGLLTVENGALWYYQGQTIQNYLGTVIQLGTSGWDGVTVLGPGTVAGRHVLWARDASGAVSQYPITFDAAGYPVNLGTPTGGSGTALSVPAGTTTGGTQVTTVPAAQYPAVYAVDLHGAGQPDLIAATANGDVIDWPGGAPSGSTATLTPPHALGNAGPAGGQVAFAEGQTIYPDGSTWSNSKTTMTLDEGVLTLTDTATGSLLKTFGTGPSTNAFLILQTDGNLDIYNQQSGGTVTWSAGTSGTGETLQLQTTGNLALVSSTGTTLWQSNTAH